MGSDLILWATTADDFDAARLAAHPDARDVVETYTNDAAAHIRAADFQREGWRVRLLRCVAEYAP